MELDKIYNMDAFEGMKQIPDASADMVLTDPPYGTTRNSWDTLIDLDEFWREIKRVIVKSGGEKYIYYIAGRGIVV